MIEGMTGVEEVSESQAATLCKSCGLCCTGHLFAWGKLKPSELDAAEALGMNVHRTDPGWRGFSQPCPLWKGMCTIHSSPNYPRVCRAYQCKLLKEVLVETTALPAAQEIVEQAKRMIEAIEPLLPGSPELSFRERLVAYIEHPDESAARESGYQDFRMKADALLQFYEAHFGVTGLVELAEAGGGAGSSL
jgi:uncharacterized protein